MILQKVDRDYDFECLPLFKYSTKGVFQLVLTSLRFSKIMSSHQDRASTNDEEEANLQPLSHPQCDQYPLPHRLIDIIDNELSTAHTNAICSIHDCFRRMESIASNGKAQNVVVQMLSEMRSLTEHINYQNSRSRDALHEAVRLHARFTEVCLQYNDSCSSIYNSS